MHLLQRNLQKMAYSRYSPDDRGHSSAVASVLFTRGSDKCETTKSGSYIYDGSPSQYHEWEFRTRLRMKGVSAESYANVMSKVIDGLRGDAFTVATTVGLESLWQAPVHDADEAVIVVLTPWLQQ